MIIGLISGAMGPFSNAPIDTIKTRMSLFLQLSHSSISSSTDAWCFFFEGLQKAPALPGTTAWSRIQAIASNMWKEEGFRSFYKGITPRVLRVAPGQAIVFAVYERVTTWMDLIRAGGEGSTYSE